MKERNEIFGFSRASAEKTGDIIEFWLGVLDVANMAKGVVNVFNASVDPAEFLNGLEKALAQFTSTSRTTNTINDRRKGSFDCTLQTAEAERVMKIIHEIPGYETLTDFNCLTKWENFQVISQFRRRHHVTGDDANMDTDAVAQPGVESPTHPEEEDADEPANDPTDVVRDSEISGKQQLLDALGKLFTVSEDVNVCLYCGSAKHGHLECEDDVKKVLKAVRASLEAESPKSDDVEMEPQKRWIRFYGRVGPT